VSWEPVHLDEDGRPCARHGAADPDELLLFAFIGTRADGFNHDLASKLQGLVMIFEELDELIAKAANKDLGRVAAVVAVAQQELSELLAGNRALARSAPRTLLRLRELVRRAGERSSVVLDGEPPDVELLVSAPVAIHALALALDVAKGQHKSGRLAASWRHLERHLELVLATGAPARRRAAEYLALASEMLRRDGGDLRCGADRLVLRLPLRAA
jgi:hypothetical protein